MQIDVHNLWYGLHLTPQTNAQIDAWVQEVPALAALGVNVLIPEMNYNYAYTSHPELQGEDPITQARVRALVEICRAHRVRLVPQFQCLGHQSWAGTTFALLAQYPEFDETPGQFPNNEGIYCRSWCPQHPNVNSIIFDLFDELLEVFEADALHVGLDEVFLIASEHCPRCKGHNPAHLFAQVVRDYHAHLVEKRGVELWMWGDRLLDAATTGYGEWEAAENGTHPAIDNIPTDIVVCDWHYTERKAYPSIPLFLDKGFRVFPAGWKDVAATKSLLAHATQCRGEHPAGARMLGYLCTTWGYVQPGALTTFPPLLTVCGK
ncbi:MAG: family 20 glycosylhydrolase [Anaerolineae bacterium]|nr:family 20 glycosylhydrolase [Anaerolineae bacterium]